MIKIQAQNKYDLVLQVASGLERAVNRETAFLVFMLVLKFTVENQIVTLIFKFIKSKLIIF